MLTRRAKVQMVDPAGQAHCTGGSSCCMQPLACNHAVHAACSAATRAPAGSWRRRCCVATAWPPRCRASCGRRRRRRCPVAQPPMPSAAAVAAGRLPPAATQRRRRCTPHGRQWPGCCGFWCRARRLRRGPPTMQVGRQHLCMVVLLVTAAFLPRLKLQPCSWLRRPRRLRPEHPGT
jgi:hypothetical protein